MEMMKRIVRIVSLAALLLPVAGCYGSYVMDYDYSAIYVAYQWDLRTFVVGEDQAFRFTVGLAGVMDNTRDRAVDVSVRDALVTGDIAGQIQLTKTGSLYAIDGLNGLSQVGALSGDYVGAALSAAGVTALEPLPASAYRLEGLEELTIAKGRHTGTVTVRATDAFIADPRAYVPGYAIAFVIDGADAEQIPAEKSFAVIAVRCENKFYGYYTRAAHVKKTDAGGNVTEFDVEASTVDDFIYTLTTVDGSTVRSDKRAGEAGEMLLTFTGSDITLSSADGRVQGTGRFNNARLLQERALELQYVVTGEDGSRTETTETLAFRNRIRDGVNEWQDEHPENY